MKILVDRVPNVKEMCLFYRDIVWVSDVCKTEHYCILSHKHCTWDKKLGYSATCDCLKEIAE